MRRNRPFSFNMAPMPGRPGRAIVGESGRYRGRLVAFSTCGPRPTVVNPFQSLRNFKTFMPEETTPDGAANNTEPQKGNSDTPPDAGEAKSFTQADLDRFVGQARRDERKRLEKQITDAQSSEVDLLKRELSQAKLELRTKNAESAVGRALTAAGADDAELLTVWILSKLEVEYGEAGEIKNLKDLVSDAKAAHPARFQPKRTGTANGAEGQRTGGGVAASMNDLIRRAAGRIPE